MEIQPGLLPALIVFVAVVAIIAVVQILLQKRKK
jgi:hypothetical protein